MPHVFANGTRLYYQQTGEGPDVVLTPPVTSNQAVWVFTGLADAVAAAGFRVTTYDLRGHGASDSQPTGYTSADMAAGRWRNPSCSNRSSSASMSDMAYSTTGAAAHRS